MCRFGLFAALLLVPAGLRAQVPPPRICAVPALSELGLRDVAGFVVMRALLDGQSTSFLLDTGADTGLVTPAAARTLPLDAGHQSLIEGTGGPGAVRPNVLLPDLRLGDLRVSGMSLPVGPLPAAPRVEPPVAGLLGADLLARFDVEIDLTGGTLRLFPPGACVQPADAPGVLPAERLGPRLAVPVRVDGHAFSALLDTGARSIVIGEAAAASLGVAPATLAVDPGGLTGGVDLREVPFHWHRFGSLEVGADRTIHPVLTVTLLRDDVAMLLGTDWLARHHVMLSWSARQVVVRPR